MIQIVCHPVEASSQLPELVRTFQVYFVTEFTLCNGFRLFLKEIDRPNELLVAEAETPKEGQQNSNDKDG